MKKVFTVIGIIFVAAVVLFFGSAMISGLLSRGDTKEEVHYEKSDFTDTWNYRELLSHPEEHNGEKYVVDLYAYSVEGTEHWLCIEKGKPNHDVWVINHSDTVVLDGDTFRVYGVFRDSDYEIDTIQETDDNLILDAYYIDILEEADDE